jgi:Putative zincin peptidase
MSFKVTWKIHIVCFILSYIFCYIQMYNISNVFLDLVINFRVFRLTGIYFFDMVIALVLLLIPITLVHEIIHGVAYSVFGGKVKYGFKGIYAYTQEVSGVVLHRTKFLIVLLAPVTVISVISVIIGNSIGSILFLLNFLGSIGDILMAIYLVKSDSNSYILDRDYGFDM